MRCTDLQTIKQERADFPFLRPSVSAFFLRLVCWNDLIDVFAQSGSALSYEIHHYSLKIVVPIICPKPFDSPKPVFINIAHYITFQAFLTEKGRKD